MFSVESFLTKEFDAKHYNCWHFACDVWSSLTGQLYMAAKVDYPADSTAQLHERALSITGSFATLSGPRSPCFVLMRRQRLEPHVGIYLKGNILHLNERGVFYAPADSVTAIYPTVTYHAPK